MFLKARLCEVLCAGFMYCLSWLQHEMCAINKSPFSLLCQQMSKNFEQKCFLILIFFYLQTLSEKYGLTLNLNSK